MNTSHVSKEIGTSGEFFVTNLTDWTISLVGFIVSEFMTLQNGGIDEIF